MASAAPRRRTTFSWLSFCGGIGRRTSVPTAPSFWLVAIGVKTTVASLLPAIALTAAVVALLKASVLDGPFSG